MSIEAGERVCLVEERANLDLDRGRPWRVVRLAQGRETSLSGGDVEPDFLPEADVAQVQALREVRVHQPRHADLRGGVSRHDGGIRFPETMCREPGSRTNMRKRNLGEEGKGLNLPDMARRERGSVVSPEDSPRERQHVHQPDHCASHAPLVSIF